jgi:RHS repeat-associated protein
MFRAQVPSSVSGVSRLRGTEMGTLYDLFEDDDLQGGLNLGRDDATANGARHHDPTVGRWINQEPVGFADGANLYRYVGNEPCNVTDPSVEWRLPRWPVAKIIQRVCEGVGAMAWGGSLYPATF